MGNLIEQIQSSGFKAAVVITGGAVGAVQALLSHPGASRFIQEVQIPYSPESMFDYLGEHLKQACSAEAASLLVGRAFERALVFSLSQEVAFPILGISCTAALQTQRVRKGADRAFIGFKTRKKELVFEVEIAPGTRVEQDHALSSVLLEKLGVFLSEAAE